MNLPTKPHYWGENYEIVTEENYSPQVSCYACSVCKKCVDKKVVFWQNDLSYCWECYGEAFSQKCVFCQKLIEGYNQMEFIYYNNKVWHKECFSQSGGGVSKPLQEGFRFRKFRPLQGTKKNSCLVKK